MTQFADDPLLARRPRKTEELDFTSLIDCVFLLLIFFMYSSAIQNLAELDVPEARHGIGVDPEQSVVVTLYLKDIQGEDARYVLGDGDGEKADLEGVKRYIEAGGVGGKRDVIIKAEKKVPHRFVMNVARLVGDIPDMRLAVAVEDK